MIIDYIDNNLNAVDRIIIEQELRENPSALQLYGELKEVMEVMERSEMLEPSAAGKERFNQMILKETQQRTATRSLFTPVFYRVAAAIALFIVAAGVVFLMRQQSDLDEIRQLVKSQEQELKLTKEMMAMLANEQSASQRMQGVNVAFKLEKADEEIINALVRTMNDDPNSNVRLAALDALSNFLEKPSVRKALIESLSKQSDPVVQISLIQLLVKMKERGVVDDLQRIVDDEGTMKAVKDEAYSGIMKLS